MGLIGLGNMGAAFAERLLTAGCDLVVHNRSPERAEPLAARGASVADSPSALAAGADVVLPSLSDDDALESVGAVVAASARPGTVVRYKTEPLLRDDYSATFTTSLMEKDVDLVLEAAEAAGVRLPVTQELEGILRSAIEAGYGDDDFMALFPHLQSASDQEVPR